MQSHANKTNLWDFHDHLLICIYSYAYNSNVLPEDDIHSKNLKFIQIRNETVILICILDLKLIQLLKCHLSPINDEKM